MFRMVSAVLSLVVMAGVASANGGGQFSAQFQFFSDPAPIVVAPPAVVVPSQAVFFSQASYAPAVFAAPVFFAQPAFHRGFSFNVGRFSGGFQRGLVGGNNFFRPGLNVNINAGRNRGFFRR